MVKQNNNFMMTVAIVLAAAFFLSGGLTGNASRRDFAYTPIITGQPDIDCSIDTRIHGEILSGGRAVLVNACGNVVEYCDDYSGSGVQSSHPFRLVRLSPYETVLTCTNRDLTAGTSPSTVIGTRPAY